VSRRKRWIIGILVVLLLLAAGVAAAGYMVWKQRHPGTIRGSGSTEFVTTDEPGATTRPEEEVRKVPWPTYGYDEQRSRVAPPAFQLRPPFKTIWKVNAKSLLEFPPVIAYGNLYVGTNDGHVLAVDSETGKVVWNKGFGICTAASPAVGRGVVYQPFMDPSPCPQHDQSAPGYMIALDAQTGAELWRFKAGVIETSPLLIDGILYFGSWDKKMYALDVKTRKVVWSFATGGQVKGGPAYSNGLLYFASYDRKVYCVDARTGRLKWSSSGNANFYATPTVAYGRVYVGNTDGRVYAFGAQTGHLLWAKATGGFVYSSAGVYRKTVYVGSYSHRFLALDAGSGDVRWAFPTDGAISGAPTILDGIVYFSTLHGKTFGLDVQTGKKIWEFDDGKYSPVVADEQHVYLVGYKKLYGLLPENG
jgi:outer membrane protein assembly factor BamB